MIRSSSYRQEAGGVLLEMKHDFVPRVRAHLFAARRDHSARAAGKTSADPGSPRTRLCGSSPSMRLGHHAGGREAHVGAWSGSAQLLLGVLPAPGGSVFVSSSAPPSRRLPGSPGGPCRFRCRRSSGLPGRLVGGDGRGSRPSGLVVVRPRDRLRSGSCPCIHAFEINSRRTLSVWNRTEWTIRFKARTRLRHEPVGISCVIAVLRRPGAGSAQRQRHTAMRNGSRGETPLAVATSTRCPACCPPRIPGPLSSRPDGGQIIPARRNCPPEADPRGRGGGICDDDDIWR